MAYHLLIGAILLIVVFAFVFIYNGLVVLKNRVENAWSQIDVQMKRRLDLIPNLVESVKGYMKHERETLEGLTKARTAWANAKSMGQQAAAADFLSGALKSLFAVAENYPNLKANENFMMLQEELSGTESKIAYARQFYNDSVLDLNNHIAMFPSSVVAAVFGFKVREFFEAEEAARKPVKVSF